MHEANNFRQPFDGGAAFLSNEFSRRHRIFSMPVVEQCVYEVVAILEVPVKAASRDTQSRT